MMIGGKAHERIEKRLILQGKFNDAVLDEAGAVMPHKEMFMGDELLMEI